MLLGQASSSEETTAVVAALIVMFGAVFLILLVVWRQARNLTDPRLRGQPLMQAPRRFGLGAQQDHVEFGGKRYRMTLGDHQVKEWLNDLVEWWRLSHFQEDHPVRLVRLRKEFRSIIAARPIGGLVCCLSDPDTELRKLAIWLLGRCSGGATVTAVKFLRSSEDPSIRRQVAKALQRMGEWTELHSMATRDDDPRVRCQASNLSNTTRRSYSDRLRQYVQHVGGEVFEPGRYSSHMPVFLLEPVGAGKPAKSRQWIRRILEHIRQLVRLTNRNRAA